MKFSIRNFRKNDIAVIASAFAALGWYDRTTLLKSYLLEQSKTERKVLVASTENIFTGYVTILWRSDYPPFAERAIPEIKDLNVLPVYRRIGIGGKLLDKAEGLISKRSDVAGIGVGMFSDYGAAQRLYVKRGYVPDARGLFYHGEYIKPEQQITVDGDLVLYMRKLLR